MSIKPTLLIVLLFLIFTFSSAYTFTSAQFLGSFPLILATVIVLSVIILAILYMISEPLSNPNLRVYVKSEIREMIVAGILFVIVSGIFSASTPVISILTGTNDYHVASHDFLQNLTNRHLVAFANLQKTNHLISMRTGFTPSVSAGVYYVAFSQSGAPHSGYGAFADYVNQAASSLSISILTLRSLDILLTFFLTTAPSLLYLAFSLRFIPFTRQIGSTLIAILIGVYIFFPFSLTFLSKTHTFDINAPPTSPQIIVPKAIIPSDTYEKMEFTIPPGAGFVCSEPWLRTLVSTAGEIGFSIPPCAIYALFFLPYGYAPAFVACFQLLTQVVYPLIANVLIPAIWAAYVLPAMFIDPNVAVVFDGLRPFFSDATSLLILVYVDTIVALIFTVVGIRSVSLALGGEYMMPGVSRFVS